MTSEVLLLTNPMNFQIKLGFKLFFRLASKNSSWPFRPCPKSCFQVRIIIYVSIGTHYVYSSIPIPKIIFISYDWKDWQIMILLINNVSSINYFTRQVWLLSLKNRDELNENSLGIRSSKSEHRTLYLYLIFTWNLVEICYDWYVTWGCNNLVDSQYRHIPIFDYLVWCGQKKQLIKSGIFL